MLKKTSLTAAALLLSAFTFSSAAMAAEEKPDFSERLTGDWGGKRSELFEKGFSFDVYYKVDAWRNLHGGANTGNRVLDNLDLQMTVDGEKALNQKGLTLFVYLLNNNGGRVNDLAGSAGGIDNIEVPARAFKVYSAWADQKFWNDKASVLVGLYDLNSEFYATDTSGLFLNPTYGIGTEVAATGNNGPSIFPYTSLAARLALQPTEETYLQAAVLDGVPGDPERPHGTHIEFDNKDGALVIVEGGVKSDAVGHFGVGAWRYTAPRPDQLDPDLRKTSQGMYLLADKSLYKKDGKDISAFARGGFTAGDVDQFKRSWSVGVVATGFVPSRPEGMLGLGLSSAANASKYRTANAPVDGHETQVELTYCDRVTPWLNVQPDLQYTVNPGTDPALRNAWTAGVRFGVDF